MADRRIGSGALTHSWVSKAEWLPADQLRIGAVEPGASSADVFDRTGTRTQAPVVYDKDRLTPTRGDVPLSHPQSSSPLRGVFGVSTGHLKVFGDSISAEQKRALVRWARSVGAPTSDERQLLVAVLSEPCRQTSERGRSTFRALRELGIVTDFMSRAVQRIEAEHGPEPLRELSIVANVHWLEDMLALVPVLGWLGAREVSKFEALPFRGTSGLPDVHVLSDLQLAHFQRPHEGSPHVYLTKESGRQGLGRVDTVGMHNRSSHSLIERYARLAQTTVDPSLTKFIAPAPPPTRAVDVHDSYVKVAETHPVVQKSLLIGARGLREYFGASLRDGHVFITGAGQLGVSAVEQLLSLDFPPDRIIVEEKDSRRRNYLPKKYGVQTRRDGWGSDEIDGVALRLGCTGTAHIPWSEDGARNGYAQKTLSIELASSPGFTDLSRTIKGARGRGLETGRAGTTSHDYILQFDDATHVLRTAGTAPNTKERHWFDRGQLTVAATVLGCVGATQFLDADYVQVPPELDSQIAEDYRSMVGYAPRPLDPQPGDDPDDLARDLRALAGTRAGPGR